MELVEIEKKLRIKFPKRHQEALKDFTDPIHQECDFFVPFSPNESLDLLKSNEWLHSGEFFNPWPNFLIAFASNGCGDYFAYDVRHNPYQIVYVDRDKTIDENLSDSENLRFDSFEKWYEATINLKSSPEFKATLGESL